MKFNRGNSIFNFATSRASAYQYEFWISRCEKLRWRFKKIFHTIHEIFIRFKRNVGRSCGTLIKKFFSLVRCSSPKKSHFSNNNDKKVPPSSRKNSFFFSPRWKTKKSNKSPPPPPNLRKTNTTHFLYIFSLRNSRKEKKGRPHRKKRHDFSGRNPGFILFYSLPPLKLAAAGDYFRVYAQRSRFICRTGRGHSTRKKFRPLITRKFHFFPREIWPFFRGDCDHAKIRGKITFWKKKKKKVTLSHIASRWFINNALLPTNIFDKLVKAVELTASCALWPPRVGVHDNEASSNCV